MGSDMCKPTNLDNIHSPLYHSQHTKRVQFQETKKSSPVTPKRSNFDILKQTTVNTAKKSVSPRRPRDQNTVKKKQKTEQERRSIQQRKERIEELIQFGERSKFKREQQRQMNLQKELEECTFKPKVNDYYFEQNPELYQNRSAEQFFEDQVDFLAWKKEKIAIYQQMQEEQEKEEVQSRPDINPISTKIIDSKNRGADIYKRNLYHKEKKREDEIRREQMERLKALDDPALSKAERREIQERLTDTSKWQETRNQEPEVSVFEPSINKGQVHELFTQRVKRNFAKELKEEEEKLTFERCCQILENLGYVKESKMSKGNEKKEQLEKMWKMVSPEEEEEVPSDNLQCFILALHGLAQPEDSPFSEDQASTIQTAFTDFTLNYMQFSKKKQVQPEQSKVFSSFQMNSKNQRHVASSIQVKEKQQAKQKETKQLTKELAKQYHRKILQESQEKDYFKAYNKKKQEDIKKLQKQKKDQENYPFKPAITEYEYQQQYSEHPVHNVGAQKRSEMLSKIPNSHPVPKSKEVREFEKYGSECTFTPDLSLTLRYRGSGHKSVSSIKNVDQSIHRIRKSNLVRESIRQFKERSEQNYIYKYPLEECSEDEEEEECSSIHDINYKEPLYKFDINLGKRVEELDIYEGEDIEEAARNFLKRHSELDCHCLLPQLLKLIHTRIEEAK